MHVSLNDQRGLVASQQQDTSEVVENVLLYFQLLFLHVIFVYPLQLEAVQPPVKRARPELPIVFNIAFLHFFAQLPLFNAVRAEQVEREGLSKRVDDRFQLFLPLNALAEHGELL